MQIVKVKDKYQVTIPTILRKKAGIEIGDILEARAEQGSIIFAPKATIDKGLIEALKEMVSGNTYGPFSSAEKLISSLHKNAKK